MFTKRSLTVLAVVAFAILGSHCAKAESFLKGKLEGNRVLEEAPRMLLVMVDGDAIMNTGDQPIG